jgi:hypothetical protein
MFTQQVSTSSRKKTPSKLIAAFAAVGITAIMTASGFASAAPAGNNKPSKEDCMKAGFPNYGQCVKEWALNKNKPGNGYGGNTSVATNINLVLNHSNNNAIEVIVNVFR